MCKGMTIGEIDEENRNRAALPPPSPLPDPYPGNDQAREPPDDYLPDPSHHNAFEDSSLEEVDYREDCHENDESDFHSGSSCQSDPYIGLAVGYEDVSRVGDDSILAANLLGCSSLPDFELLGDEDSYVEPTGPCTPIDLELQYEMNFQQGQRDDISLITHGSGYAIPRFPSTNIPEHLAQYPNIGQICPSRVDGEDFQQQVMDDEDCSMLRLMEYCDHSSHNSREFLDELLKIIGEEMQGDRSFNPAMAPKRETVVRRAMERYGTVPSSVNTEGMGRRATQKTRISTKPDVLKIRTKSTTDPKEIEALRDFPEWTRGREMVEVIRFDLVHAINDLLSDRKIWGNKDNLNINEQEGMEFAPYVPKQGGLEVMDGSWYREIIRIKLCSRRGLFPVLQLSSARVAKK